MDMRAPEVEVAGESYVIDEQELMLQSFGIDNPNMDPISEDFSRDHFHAAKETLKYTDAIDRKLNVEILDTNRVFVSRDVLAMYKTLVYRAGYTSNQLQVSLSIYKQLSFCFALGLLVTLAVVALSTPKPF